MSLISWKDIFSVGVKDIDDQHKKLIELINTLNDAFLAGQDRSVLGDTLRDLISYTQTHFVFEEQLMEKYDYPLTAQHQREHRDLVKTVGDFRIRYEQGEFPLTDEVMVFLRDWLSRHIMNSDKTLGRNLNSKGVR